MCLLFFSSHVFFVMFFFCSLSLMRFFLICQPKSGFKFEEKERTATCFQTNIYCKMMAFLHFVCVFSTYFMYDGILDASSPFQAMITGESIGTAWHGMAHSHAAYTFTKSYQRNFIGNFPISSVIISTSSECLVCFIASHLLLCSY